MRRAVACCVLAACGGGGGGSESPDAAPASGPISVHAAAGTHVLFRGGDGVVQDVVADGSGLATAISGANTSATIVSSTGFFAYEGLNPGDAVDNVAPTVVPDPGVLKPAPTVVLPRYQDAVSYMFAGSSRAAGSLQDTTTSPTITGPIGAFDTPHKTDAKLVATTQTANGTFAYSVVEHADLTGGPITFPAFQPTPMASLAVSIPLPVRMAGLTVDRYDASDPSSILSAVVFYPDANGAYHAAQPPVGDSVLVAGYFDFDSAREVDYFAYGTEAVDGTEMPHLGIGATWDGTKAVWMESSEGADPLMSYISINAGGAQIFIVAPYHGPSVELPPLPASVDTSGAFVTIAATMAFAPGTSYLDAIPRQYEPRWKVRILQ